MKRVFLKGKICDAPNCVRPATRRMLCTQHYQRLRSRGDVADQGQRLRGEGETFEQRFWSRVALTANPDRCWNWLGGTQANASGMEYGRLTREGGHIQAHRAAFEIVNGYAPTNILRHTCDNPLCVNPSHLLEGTNADNARDAVERGRIPRGSASGVAALDEDRVATIKMRLNEGERVSGLALEYGVSRGTLDAIKSGKTWKHVII